MRHPKKLFLPFFLILVLAMAGGFLAGQNLEDKFHARTLGNGMTVILVERHGAPVFSTIYGFKVGSVDEIPGITGTAHLFEHMAFKGTPKIGTSDFEKEKPIMEKVNQVGREWSLELVKGDREPLLAAEVLEPLYRVGEEWEKLVNVYQVELISQTDR
jgi:hypothetical protein